MIKKISCLWALLLWGWAATILTPSLGYGQLVAGAPDAPDASADSAIMAQPESSKATEPTAADLSAATNFSVPAAEVQAPAPAADSLDQIDSPEDIGSTSTVPIDMAPAVSANEPEQVLDLYLPAAEPSLVLENIELAAGATNLISISLTAVPVSDVVNMFSKISGANIIIAGSITNATITANLKNVEWKTALSLALGSVNLSLIEDPSGILMVVTAEMYREKLQQLENTKPLVTKTIALRYLNVVDFIEQIKALKILSPRGTIISSQSREQELHYLKSSPLSTEIIQNPAITSEIIVTDIKEYVDKVESLANALDKREPQVFIEVRVIDVASDNSKKTGFDWSMLDRFGATLRLQDVKWSFADDHEVLNVANNNLNEYDKRHNLDAINKRYDLNGQPYEETTTTYEESPPGSGNWIAHTVITPTRTITDTLDRGRDITMTKTDTIRDTTKESKAGTAILSATDLALFLSFLQTKENTEMISHPLIVVGNKVEAKIHVGDRYPTVISTKQAANPQQGQTESFSERVEWNDLGLTLWVIPEIDHNMDMIRMTVYPQMSTHLKDITTAAGSVYPVITTRQVSTRVNIPSKHTVVIGGLIENRKDQREIKVPILGDIPLLGLLFKHNQDVITRHNLLILLTPTILDERAPLTGLEVVAQQTIDVLEKVPLAPNEQAALTNAAAQAGSSNAAAASQTMSSSASIVESAAAASPSAAAAAAAPPAPGAESEEQE